MSVNVAEPKAANITTADLTAMLAKRAKTSLPSKVAATSTGGSGSSTQAQSESASGGEGGTEETGVATEQVQALGERNEEGQTSESQNGTGTAEEQSAETTLGEGGEAAEGQEADGDGQTEGEGNGESAADEGVRAPGEMPAELAEAIEALKKDGKNGQAQLLKRVHKLVDARDTERMGRLQLQQENESLKAQLQEASQDGSRGAPSGAGDRFAGHPEVKALDDGIANANNIIEWADTALAQMEGDGTGQVEVEDGRGGKKTYTAQQVRQFQKQAEREQIRLSSERAAQVSLLRKEEGQLRAQYNGQARQLYPWITDKSSAEHQEALRILRTFPAIAQAPGAELIVGRYIEGMKLEKSKVDSRGTKVKPTVLPTKPKVNTPAPVAARASAVAPRVNATQAGKQAAADAFRKSGKTSDLVKRFAAAAA